jgi:hypothetical protein
MTGLTLRPIPALLAVAIVSFGARDDVGSRFQVVQDEGIPIYVLSTRSFPASASAFRELTDSTGGRNYLAANWAAQKLAFESIEEDLDATYAITYYPTNRDGAFRQVNARIASETGTSDRVHARAGYRPSHIKP